MLRTLARNWWLVLAGLVSIFEVVFGVAMPFAEGGNPGSIAGGAFIAGAGLLVLGGIIVRWRRSRFAGDIMIAVGALPTLPWMWLILPPLAGLILILVAAVDAAEARSLGQRQWRRTASASQLRRVAVGIPAGCRDPAAARRPPHPSNANRTQVPARKSPHGQ